MEGAYVRNVHDREMIPLDLKAIHLVAYQQIPTVGSKVMLHWIEPSVQIQSSQLSTSITTDFRANNLSCPNDKRGIWPAPRFHGRWIQLAKTPYGA